MGKIFGTGIADVMDNIIENTIKEIKSYEKSDLLRYFREKNQDGQLNFFAKLEKEIPNWKNLTSADNPVKYMINHKLPYRINRILKKYK